MTKQVFEKGISRIMVKLSTLLSKTFGFGGHDYITSASVATGDQNYFWIVAKEETVLTYTDCRTGITHTDVTIPAFFEIGGSLKDISVTSGEILAYRK